jgi:uracil phosphoribosyltransferase
MNTIEVNHPLIKEKLTIFRDKNTTTEFFRKALDELMILLSFEATKDIKVEKIEIETPLEKTIGYKIAEPLPIVIPVLRAGLGLLNGILSVLPKVPVGFLGMVRNDKTLQIETYAERLPNDLTGRHAIVIDPMLATGNTLAESVKYLLNKNIHRITIITVISATEGIKQLEKVAELSNMPINLYTAKIDRELNNKFYIMPGLGDAGDRLYGYID